MSGMGLSCRFGVGILAIAAGTVAMGVGASSVHRARTPQGAIAYVPARPGGTGVRVAQLSVARLDWKDAHLLLRAPGAVSAAVWSPDGNRIAVSYARPKAADGALIADSHGRIMARVDGSVRSWSPDGRYLATDDSAPLDCREGHVVKRQLRLHVFTANGRLARTLPLLRAAEVDAQTGADAPVISSIAWSPDAWQIAYVVSAAGCEPRAGIGTSTVRIVDVESGAVRILYRPQTNSWHYLGPPAWSPDLRSIAFAAGCSSGGMAGEGCDSLVIVGRDGRRRSVLRPRDSLVDTVVWTGRDTLVFGTPFSAGASLAGLAAIDVPTKRWHWIVRAPTRLGSLVDAVFPIFKLSRDGRELITVESYSSGIAVSAVDGSRSWRTTHAWSDDRIIEDIYAP